MVDDGSGRYTRDPSSDDDRRTNECPTECVACAECSLADAERIAARPAGCMCNDESPKEAPSKQCRSFCDDTVGERSACHESAG
jgi:hypothetical protein